MSSVEAELLHRVATKAIRCGYLLAGPLELAYARTTDRRHTVVRVPAWEDATVHELLSRGWLTRGDPQQVSCGAAQLSATAVDVPRGTRARVARGATSSTSDPGGPIAASPIEAARSSPTPRRPS